jgi:hypothetical protein
MPKEIMVHIFLLDLVNFVPYSVLYETPADGGLVGPSLDIISRSGKGPSKPTLDAIYDGIKDLHNDALDALLKIVVKLPQNGGRNGQLFPSCNATCQTNGTLSPGSARQTRKATVTLTMCSIRVWRCPWNWRCLGIRHVRTSKFQGNYNPNFSPYFNNTAGTIHFLKSRATVKSSTFGKFGDRCPCQRRKHNQTPTFVQH